jgi:acyl dehydratase
MIGFCARRGAPEGTEVDMKILPRLPRSRAVGAAKFGAAAAGAAAIGAIAAGAAAIGALAIGRLAIGSLALGRARIGRLEIDQLVVRRTVNDARGTGPSAPDRPAWLPKMQDRPAQPRTEGAFYLDDFAVGQTFRSGTLTLDAEQIKAFAASFDPQPFHLDEAAAAESLFGGLVASGWHTAALTMRLLTSGGLPIGGGIIGRGAELSWPKPVRPGDTLRAESEVVEIVPSRSKPDSGTVTVRSTTYNQNDEPVQTMTARMIVKRRG